LIKLPKKKKKTHEEATTTLYFAGQETAPWLLNKGEEKLGSPWKETRNEPSFLSVESKQLSAQEFNTFNDSEENEGLFTALRNHELMSKELNDI
jgi:hypothetical protein